MNLEMTLFDNRKNILYDISEIVDDISISTQIREQPGKCTFKIVRTDNLAFWEGATVSVRLDGVNMFKGYVFGKKRNKDVDLITITAYDQLRYLKNKDSFAFEGLTSSQIFSKLCTEYALKHRVVSPSRYVCTPRNNTDKALYEMIDASLSDTLINSKQWFIIRDNFGVLEHINILDLHSGIVIGDYQGLMDFDYETSIDKDTYNQIKLYKKNKKTKKAEIFIVNDTINGGNNLKEWGILQLYEEVPDTLNAKQIEQRAIGMLSLYNNTSRSLKLECIGAAKVTAGSIITCAIEDLGDISIKDNLLVTSCTHTIKNKLHDMSLQVEVVR